MSFSCVIIGRGPQSIACADVLLGRGHRIACIVSDCPAVTAWSQKAGVTRVDPAEKLFEVLGLQPFEYLFSIVNHRVTPKEVVALPTKGALNYHDSPLPEYGGFNATSWAILDGLKEHGITWHRMTAKVDSGSIVVQRTLPILPDDTAFSLSARAGELAVRAFAEMVAGLEDGSLAETPGQPVRNFHFRSQRPGFPVLRWDRGVSELSALVRGLDFGTEDNWMTRAKLATPAGEFLCVGSLATSASTQARPGHVLGVSADALTISAADGIVMLGDLTTIDGQPVTMGRLEEFGVRDGAVLSGELATLAERITAFDVDVTNKERYWQNKLASLHPVLPPELKPHAPSGAPQRLTVPLSDLGTVTPSTVVAALAAYLCRVGEDVSRVDVGLVQDWLPLNLRPLYTTVVPITLNVTPAMAWADLQAQSGKELDECAARKTFARDIYTRYSSLRKKTADACVMPLAVAFSPVQDLALPLGTKLVVVYDSAAHRLELVFDDGAIGRVHAARLGERLSQLIGAALSAPTTSLADLPIITVQERDLLLHAFQDTARPAAEVACIHHLIAAAAARTPDANALVFREETISYAELEARANALAHRLTALGVGPDQLVAVCIERSIEMVVGLLAILKAGGAYIPLDPAYPQERLAIMLQDGGARWLLTQSHLQTQLPVQDVTVILVNTPCAPSDRLQAPKVDVRPEHLAYVIFTSGSTGRPKGVMVEHRNVANFFAGMDERIGTTVGTWLAVTSISFDISVLELFWTLARGFQIVIQEEGDRASLLKSQVTVSGTTRPMGFGLFYFAADSRSAGVPGAYRLLLEGAKFADTHDFVAVWTPERHFHEFGGLYPNPAITSAAIAAITSQVQVRAGSVVIPLHDPIRVAEEWAMVDNLSGGRVGLSFASGWHANDFALKPDNYERRQEVMRESIDTVLRLWSGEKISVKNGRGETIEVSALPRPVRSRPPMWIASAGNIETFKSAGRLGYNILTNMLGQDLKDLASKFAAYREARQQSDHTGDGTISVMLHTFVTDSDDKARELSRRPFGQYLKSSYDLVKVAPWMFPAFKRPSAQTSADTSSDPQPLDENDMEALLDHAFDRYFDTAGLFGTPARALALVEKLKDIGATEVACLIDFGVDPQVVLDNLVHLDELRRLANPTHDIVETQQTPVSIREQFENHRITHFQCTPSMARMLLADGTLNLMGGLRKMLVGGEAMPADLAATLTAALPNTEVLNMYGPTETTVWSTVATIGRNGEPITIGTPIANTQIRLLDTRMSLVPLGAAAELCIGGAGVVRGYLNQPALTEARFVPDPYAPTGRLYRTGDLARYRDDGALEYIGRIDHQVKVNGYRIELGEIETILGRHAAVKEAVVAVKTLASNTALVGYVVPSGGAQQSKEKDADVDDWKRRWEAAYRSQSGAAQAPPRFNTSGWLSSYTGEPIDQQHMRQWLDETTKRIDSLACKRVLEIGCGTGMLLYSCLANVDHYTAIDLSPFALESIRAELSVQERQKVTLLNQAAHDLKGFADHSFDLVVINSVAQYFPNAEYLVDVLKQCGRVLVDGGKVFLGDVRSLEEAHAFAALVELHKAPGQMSAALLAKRIEERATLESELLLAASFFRDVSNHVPRLSVASIALKRGALANEMRDFRSDVVLQAGQAPRQLSESELHRIAAPKSKEDLRAALAQPFELTEVKGIVNARISSTHDVMRRVAALEDTTVERLRETVASPGIDPNDLFDISQDHDVEVRFGEAPGTFDALFRNKQTAPTGVWPIQKQPQSQNANVPRARAETEGLVPKLKAHIRGFLPEYMVPQSFVFLTAFPLTPNGKIDRKALPMPTEAALQSVADYVVPSTDLERQIADIWRDMLGVERVGRKDNIFDLGASSLLTVEANGRLQKLLGRKIPLVAMFRYPTIEALASHLAKAMAAESPTSAPADTSSLAEQERQSRLNAAAERRRQARARSS